MIISGAVVAHKILSDNKELDDNVSAQLPTVSVGTSSVVGAGVMGSFEMPSTGQIDSMALTINTKSSNKNLDALARPGKQNIELRVAKDAIVNGTHKQVGIKVFVTGIMKKYDPGKIENGSTMDGSIEFEVLRYRQVVDGVETLLIDKENSIYKVMGIDYMANVRKLLN